MSVVIPIVEGHGEQKCIRILLQRIGIELLDAVHIEVLRPIRIPRSKLVQKPELEKAVELAARKSIELGHPDALILIMLDADKDAACTLGPKILNWAKRCRGDFEIACELVIVEYETWFAGAAESLSDYIDLEGPAPENPEENRHGKAWIRQRYQGPAYSETIDQPAMTNAVDLQLVKARCPSFDRLCRIIELHSRSSD